MDRHVLIAGTVVVAIGAAVFAWKTVGLGLPVLPSETEHVWEVQLDVAIRGTGEAGSVRVALPGDGPSQRIFGERFSSNGLRLEVRTDDAGRREAIWSGPIDDVDQVSHRFNVQVFSVDPPRGVTPGHERSGETRATQPLVDALEPAPAFPVDAPEVSSLLDELDLALEQEAGDRVRTLFAFARHEVSESPSGSDDALLALAQRTGSPHGRERLLVTLLRAAKVPARIVRGLELRESAPGPLVWSEVWMDGRWVPVSAGRGFFGALPDDVVRVATGDQPLVEGVGTRAVGFEYVALRKRLSADDLASLMVPPSETFRSLSLYRLPVPTQEGLRVLLLFCAATLVVSVLRVGVGVPSYGTFMPALLALAMRATGLVEGLFLVAVVVVVGLAGRLVLDRLRLLFVPRLSILVCTVVLTTALIGLLGRSFGSAGLYGGVLLPIVIVTMMIERFAIVLDEDGPREALVRAACSGGIAIAAYPVLRSEGLGHLLFAFPELVLVIIGLQLWLGGYTGYRLVELVRFRALRASTESA
jgi:hypothetical protein